MNHPMYFDYMATTPCDPQVIDLMIGHLGLAGNFANPASQHGLGQLARQAVETARHQVAAAINATAEEVIWTSGATESDNLAIKGACDFYQRNGKHIITMSTEHKAVLDCFEQLSRQGFEVTYLKPQQNGLLSLNDLQQALREDTILVSIMHVNNEIGVIQPIEQIAQLVKEKGAIMHVDAAQSIGKVEIDVRAMGIDLMSFSAHKAYGPKGIGALYIKQRPRVRLTAQMHGGGHERGYRSGTLATHQIVGMGKAFELAQQQLETDQANVARYFEKVLSAVTKLGGVHLNGDIEQRVKNNLSLSFEGIDGESLLYAFSQLSVSSTSACASASIEPSYVIKSLGVEDSLAHSTVRLSFGRFTTDNHVDAAIQLITEQVKRLRGLYGL
jgi:cysteine desulfurase